MQGEQVAAGHLLVGASFEVVLPVVLPQLLKSMGQQSRGAASTALLLQRLVAALERSGAATGGQAQLLSCLLACRHSLPVDMWPLLCSIL